MIGHKQAAKIAADHTSALIIGHSTGPPTDSPRIASTADDIGWYRTSGWTQSGYCSNGTNPVQKVAPRMTTGCIASTRRALRQYSAAVVTSAENATPKITGTATHSNAAGRPAVEAEPENDSRAQNDQRRAQQAYRLGGQPRQQSGDTMYGQRPQPGKKPVEALGGDADHPRCRP